MAIKARSLILIDDDKQHNQMLEQYIKQKFKLSIYSFNSGEEAIKQMGIIQPSFVILDYHLDGVDKNAKNGLDVLKVIKKIYPDVNVIMLSGQDKIDVAVDTLKYGAYDYVVKSPSGFVRIENILLNIQKNIRLKNQAKSYRFATIFLTVGLVAIIAMALIFWFTGISSKSPGW